jgi:hypothetical protein
MRSEQQKTQSIAKNEVQQFRRERQDEFLFDELRGTLEETWYNCNHNKEMSEAYGYEDTHSFIIKKCDVCEQELIVPDQHVCR